MFKNIYVNLVANRETIGVIVVLMLINTTLGIVILTLLVLAQITIVVLTDSYKTVQVNGVTCFIVICNDKLFDKLTNKKAVFGHGATIRNTMILRSSAINSGYGDEIIDHEMVHLGQYTKNPMTFDKTYTAGGIDLVRYEAEAYATSAKYYNRVDRHLPTDVIKILKQHYIGRKLTTEEILIVNECFNN